MSEKRCYTHNKPNCESQYCDVETGNCIRKTKTGRPYKTKLDTKLGSSYYYDENYGLVGTMESVNEYIKEIKASKKETKDAKISKKSKKISPSKVVESKKKTSPPKVVESKKKDVPTAKTIKHIQDRIDNIMSGEELSREFLKSKSNVKKSVKKSENTLPKKLWEISASKTLKKLPETTLLIEKKLRDYKSVIGLINGECYG
jgi:hypothetical protein